MPYIRKTIAVTDEKGNIIDAVQKMLEKEPRYVSWTGMAEILIREAIAARNNAAKKKIHY